MTCQFVKKSIANAANAIASTTQSVASSAYEKCPNIIKTPLERTYEVLPSKETLQGGLSSLTTRIKSATKYSYNLLPPKITDPLYATYAQLPPVTVFAGGLIAGGVEAATSVLPSQQAVEKMIDTSAEKAAKVTAHCIETAKDGLKLVREIKPLAWEIGFQGKRASVLGKSVQFGKDWKLEDSEKSAKEVEKLSQQIKTDQAAARRTSSLLPGGTQVSLETTSSLEDQENKLQTETSSPSSTFQKQEKTDESLKILSNQLSIYSTLEYIHSTICKKADPSSSLLKLVNLATQKDQNGNPPSLWKLYMKEFGKEMSWFQWMRAGLFYLFFYQWIPVIPNTTKAYLVDFLKTMRSGFLAGGNIEKRAQVFSKIIQKTHRLFSIHNEALRSFATESPRTGEMSDYISNSIDHIAEVKQLSRELGKHLGELLSPTIEFPLFQRPINWLVNWFVKRWILPSAIEGAFSQGIKSTSPQNFLFYQALTKTFSGQLAKLEQQMDNRKSQIDLSRAVNLSHIPGTENLDPCVKEILKSLVLADCTTPEEIRAQYEIFETLGEEERKNPGNSPKTLDAKARKGFEDSTLTASQQLLLYLSDPVNIEELFGTFFDLASSPFSGNLPQTENEWKARKKEYENDEKYLREEAFRIFNKDVDETIKREAGVHPESHERSHLFANKMIEKEAFTIGEVSTLLETKTEKLTHLQNQDSSLETRQEFFVELNTMLGAFDHLKSGEELTDLASALPIEEADKESFFNSILPIYEKSARVVKSLRTVQEKKKNHLEISRSIKTSSSILASLKKIQLSDIEFKQKASSLSKEIEELWPRFKEDIHLLSPESSKELFLFKTLGEEISSLSTKLDLTLSELTALKTLAKDENGKPCLIRQSIGNFRETQPKIKKELNKLQISEEKKTSLLKQIELLTRGPSLTKAWDSISKLVTEVQNEKTKAFQMLRVSLNTKNAELEEKIKAYQKEKEKELFGAGTVLHAHFSEMKLNVKEFFTLTKAVKLEEPIEISEEKFREYTSKGAAIATGVGVYNTALTTTVLAASNLPGFSWLKYPTLAASGFASYAFPRGVTFLKEKVKTGIHNSVTESKDALSEKAKELPQPSLPKEFLGAAALATATATAFYWGGFPGYLGINALSTWHSAWQSSKLKEIPEALDEKVKDITDKVIPKVRRNFENLWSLITKGNLSKGGLLLTGQGIIEMIQENE